MRKMRDIEPEDEDEGGNGKPLPFIPPPKPVTKGQTDLIERMIEECWSSGCDDSQAYGYVFNWVEDFTIADYMAIVARRIEAEPEWKNNALAMKEGQKAAIRVNLKRELFRMANPNFALEVGGRTMPELSPKQDLNMSLPQIESVRLILPDMKTETIEMKPDEHGTYVLPDTETGGGSPSPA